MTTQILILIFLCTVVAGYIGAKMGAKQRKKFYSTRKDAAQTTESTASGEKESTLTAEGTVDKDGIPGEVLAAIFMALHEEQKVVHDYENTVLTMNRVVRNYSPWNSKFYGLRRLPRR
jgi:hypothetical protein